MNNHRKTIVIRHRRENCKKCSLSGLEERTDFLFLRYPQTQLPDITDYVLLTLDSEAPVISKKDSSSGILLLDATWKLASKMESQLPLTRTTRRSLPTKFQTAYPRRQLDCPYPDAGLASIEALAIAYYLTERDCRGLLDHYYWKDSFLKLNLLPPSLF